jgi:hypothetical protein
MLLCGEHEAKMISDRTRAALAAAKARFRRSKSATSTAGCTSAMGCGFNRSPQHCS